MYGCSKGSVWPSITVHYNVLLDASMHGYNKGRLGPSLTVHYKGYVEFSAIVTAVWGPP
jgi:hypothetical protein